MKTQILYLLEAGHTSGSEFPRSQSKKGNETSFMIASVHEIKISLLHEKVPLFFPVQDTWRFLQCIFIKGHPVTLWMMVSASPLGESLPVWVSGGGPHLSLRDMNVQVSLTAPRAVVPALGPWSCGQEPWEDQLGSASGVAPDSRQQASADSGATVATPPPKTAPRPAVRQSTVSGMDIPQPYTEAW